MIPNITTTNKLSHRMKRFYYTLLPVNGIILIHLTLAIDMQCKYLGPCKIAKYDIIQFSLGPTGLLEGANACAWSLFLSFTWTPVACLFVILFCAQSIILNDEF